ncbi:MAG: hypothetical protein V4637_15140 [Pseudomonadota bacterium]
MGSERNCRHTDPESIGEEIGYITVSSRQEYLVELVGGGDAERQRHSK